MTEDSAPWGGTTIGDAGPYTDADWSLIWKNLFHAVKFDRGILPGSGTAPDLGLYVTATGPASASVNVSPGSALINGKFYRSDAVINLPIAANASGNPRLDAIMIRTTFASQITRMVVKQGTAAVSPLDPLQIRDATVWEHTIAIVAVANGFATIAQADITQLRDMANTSDWLLLEDVKNNSSPNFLMNYNNLAVWDFSADRSAKVVTSGIHTPEMVGISESRLPNTGWGRFINRGICHVYIDSAVASRGLPVVMNAAGNGQCGVASVNDDVSKMFSIGFTLETTSGAGPCLCYVDIPLKRNRLVKKISYVGAADKTTTLATFTDSDAANHILTILPQSTRVRVTADFVATGAVGDSEFDIISTGLAARAGDATHGLNYIPAGVTAPVHLDAIFIGIIPSLSVGQSFKIVMRSITAGQTTTIKNNGRPVSMNVEEI